MLDPPVPDRAAVREQLELQIAAIERNSLAPAIPAATSVLPVASNPNVAATNEGAAQLDDAPRLEPFGGAVSLMRTRLPTMHSGL